MAAPDATPLGGRCGLRRYGERGRNRLVPRAEHARSSSSSATAHGQSQEATSPASAGVRIISTSTTNIAATTAIAYGQGQKVPSRAAAPAASAAHTPSLAVYTSASRSSLSKAASHSSTTAVAMAARPTATAIAARRPTGREAECALQASTLVSALVQVGGSGGCRHPYPRYGRVGAERGALGACNRWPWRDGHVGLACLRRQLCAGEEHSAVRTAFEPESRAFGGCRLVAGPHRLPSPCDAASAVARSRRG